MSKMLGRFIKVCLITLGGLVVVAVAAIVIFYAFILKGEEDLHAEMLERVVAAGAQAQAHDQRYRLE